MMPDSLPVKNKFSRWFVIFSLVFAGEMIFSLPFHVARFFRPTLLDVFNLTNTELGDIIAVYGITAMLAYFPGGALADRFSARKLMTLSLLATGLGGFYFAQIPNQAGLFFLFGYWGITTIFLFWAAMIKATRDWGGHLSQGKAFGILDGGRGLVAAGAATLAVLILSAFMSGTIENTSDTERQKALEAVIYFYTFMTIIAAVLTWLFITDTDKKNIPKKGNIRKSIKEVLHKQVVWLQAIIVVCAYSAYKALDYYSLYGVDVLGMNEVDSAWFVSNASYIRAVSAIAAGFIVDRLSASKVISFLFGILVISYVLLSILKPDEHMVTVIISNIIITFIAVYALRGVYFAMLEETKVSGKLTGTAVGLISVIGYTPDAFFNSLAGRILDASPGLKGYQHFYLVLAVFSVVGLLATLLLVHAKKNKPVDIT
ncbi:MAG: MFS transporter [Bacteroidetes bacterium]|nr:MAG: MFS transporter [Bacteroidota bacterium]